MILIGISGKAGCGKTTLANALCAGYGFTKVAFGDELKDECVQFTGLPLEYFILPELKEIMVPVAFGHIVPRLFMQRWGTEFRRAHTPNYWLQALWQKILLLQQTAGVKRIVVDDVRFKNEVLFIRHHAGFVVRLDPYPDYVSPPGDNHASETDLDDYIMFDYRFAPAYGEIHTQAVVPLISGLTGLVNGGLHALL